MISAPTSPGIASAKSAAKRPRLAIVLSHPVQYYSPWFRQITESGKVDLRVFYLWDPEATGSLDRSFGREVKWDIPLRDGYSHEFVPNADKDPGTHHFSGLDNPSLRNRLLKWKPDAILLFGYAWKTHLRIILDLSLGTIPLVLRGDSHELNEGRGFRRSLGTCVRRLLFRRFSGFLSVGTAHDKYLTLAGVPARKIFRCPHVVDNSRFQQARASAEADAAVWRVDLGIAPNRPVALFAGKFEEKKRPLDLLRAFLSLDPASHPDKPALLFVGNGPQEAQLHKLAGEEAGRSVFFAPFQNQTYMPRAYAAGDFFVLPSFGRGETWGLAINEAMNLAKAVIVSTHVGCGPDLIQEGETGWRFEAGNTAALAVTLKRAFADRAAVRRMGETAARRISLYSYERATNALVECLEEQIAPG